MALERMESNITAVLHQDLECIAAVHCLKVPSFMFLPIPFVSPLFKSEEVFPGCSWLQCVTDPEKLLGTQRLLG